MYFIFCILYILLLLLLLRLSSSFSFSSSFLNKRLVSCARVNSVYGIKDKMSDMEKNYSFPSVIVPSNHALLLWNVL